MDIRAGDKVQIKNGAKDVTNGVSAVAGKMYGEGGPLWGAVERIDENWNTGSRWGLPAKVTKVRVKADSGVIVWQVQPQDISPQVVRASQPETVKAAPVVTPTPIAVEESEDKKDSVTRIVSPASAVSSTINRPYVTYPDSGDWTNGSATSGQAAGVLSVASDMKVQTGSKSPLLEGEVIEYTKIQNKPNLLGGAASQGYDKNVSGQKVTTSMGTPAKQRILLNQDTENLQNGQQFPQLIQNSKGLLAARYNYQIDVGGALPLMGSRMEDQLMKARASLGIPVHGNPETAREMKYYMYNRFKTPDINMAHGRSFTHVFFTRPDLNILNYTDIPGNQPGAHQQVQNHTEAAILWRRNPLLFKLLKDREHCGDDNNFNLLLSNQITSFDVQDENLSTTEVGRSWSQYEMIYGDQYSGRAAGEFSCNFVELNDYSIINLIKLWITYIDNVSRGAWNPSYNLFDKGGNLVNTEWNASHVYSRTLDYGASVYLFKVAADGETILYWSKYYGIFPINTGASALSWELASNPGDTPKLNIRFKYSYKRDMSPISLIEFNRAANWSDGIYESSFNPEYGHSSRPYVGAPFVEMLIKDPDGWRSNSSIRLKYRPKSQQNLTDELIYRSSMANRSVQNKSVSTNINEFNAGYQRETVGNMIQE